MGRTMRRGNDDEKIRIGKRQRRVGRERNEKGGVVNEDEGETK